MPGYDAERGPVGATGPRGATGQVGQAGRDGDDAVIGLARLADSFSRVAESNIVLAESNVGIAEMVKSSRSWVRLTLVVALVTLLIDGLTGALVVRVRSGQDSGHRTLDIVQQYTSPAVQAANQKYIVDLVAGLEKCDHYYALLASGSAAANPANCP